MRVSIMAGHRNSPPPKVISTPRWWPSLARSSGSGPANSNTRCSKFILAQTTAAHEYSGAVFTAQAPAVALCCDSRGNRPLPVHGDYAILTLSPKLAGSRRALVTSTAGLCLARAANGGFGVERGGWTRSTATTAFVKGFRMPARRRREGMHGGRRPKSLEGGNRGGVRAPAQQKEAVRRRARGATLQELAHSYNVSRATISRLTATL
jgi:hypothetical protein